MNRMLLAASMLLLAGSAHAADLVSIDPGYDLAPAEVATGDWSGFYLGIHGGYASGTVVDEAGGSGDYSVHGGIFGVQGGYNAQFDMFVLGLEGDVSFGDLEGVFELIEGGLSPNDVFTVSRIATLRARAGVDLGGVLVYGTAGAAFAWAHGTFEGDDTADELSIGYVAGIGAEARLTDAVSVKAEYLYAAFPEQAYDYVETNSIYAYKMGIHTARVGLNYAF